jgi:hypothetical protein
LNRTQQVVLFREENNVCPFTDYKLTDLNGILIGNRDRHIGFSGANSNVFLSGVGLQELNRYVLEHTYTFETREGQIINFAIDKLLVFIQLKDFCTRVNTVQHQLPTHRTHVNLSW